MTRKKDILDHVGDIVTNRGVQAVAGVLSAGIAAQESRKSFGGGKPLTGTAQAVGALLSGTGGLKAAEDLVTRPDKKVRL